MKDYAVEIKVRNNWLLAKMLATGFETAAELSRACCVSQSTIGELLNLKAPFQNPDGTWRAPVARIAEALRCLPEDICPPQHRDSPLRKNTATFEASATEVFDICYSLRSVAQPAIALLEARQDAELFNSLVHTLPERERRIIEARFGLIDGEERTLQSLAKEMGVNKERVRQIEARGLRRLKTIIRSRAPWLKPRERESKDMGAEG